MPMEESTAPMKASPKKLPQKRHKNMFRMAICPVDGPEVPHAVSPEGSNLQQDFTPNTPEKKS